MRTNRTIATLERLENRTLMSAGGTPRPSNLRAAVAGSHVTLTWNDNSTNETGFAIYRQSSGGKDHSIVQVGEVPPNSKTFSDTAIGGANIYFVRATSTTGPGEASNSVTVKIVDDSVASAVAPRKLMTVALTPRSLAVSWSGDFGATGGYIVERSLDGKNNWAQIATTTTPQYTDTGLQAATKYYYRVIVVGTTHNATSAVVVGVTKKNDVVEKLKK